MMDINTNASSCIKGVNSKMCKVILDKIPDKFRLLFTNSLYFGKFATAWTCAILTLIPKDGDNTQAGNWRPISPTVIYAKILEKKCT